MLGDWYGLPSWLPRVLPALALGGLGVTLVLAWYHGGRGRQIVRLSEAGLLALVLLLTTGGVVLTWPEPGEPTDPAASVDRAGGATDAATLAVLPFENLSASSEWEYFADGLADELITVLGRIRGLTVAGGSASFRLI